MIYLIRHTKPFIAPGICYGQSDLDVYSSFKGEVSNIRLKLALDTSFKFISSPLQRCKKLAEALSNNGTIQFDTRIKELNFGDWELLPWTKIDQDDVKKWSENFVENSPPNGESFEKFSCRVIDFWSTLDHMNTNYVITAHDGVLRAILAHILETPLKKAFTLKIKYGEVIKVDFFDVENCRVEFVG